METLEQIFVNKCIIKEKRERLIYELDGKKRRDGISRFCHDTEKMLVPERIVLAKPASESELMQMLTEKELAGLCSVMAYDTKLDGRRCTVREALEAVLGNGMAAVIMTDSFAVIETEQCYGTPVRYVVRY